MAATTINAYSDDLTAALPPLYAPLKTNRMEGRVRCANFRLTLASQVSGTNFAVAILPKGARIIQGTLAASATLANSATLAVGLAATDKSGQIDDATGNVTKPDGTIGAGPISDAIAMLKAAAVQGTAQVPFAATMALGYTYELAKESFLTLTTGTGTVATEVVMGNVFYVVD